MPRCDCFVHTWVDNFPFAPLPAAPLLPLPSIPLAPALPLTELRAETPSRGGLEGPGTAVAGDAEALIDGCGPSPAFLFLGSASPEALSSSNRFAFRGGGSGFPNPSWWMQFSTCSRALWGTSHETRQGWGGGGEGRGDEGRGRETLTLTVTL